MLIMLMGTCSLKKYNSKILGFTGDKDRIPGISILLNENQKFKIGSLDFKVIFTPGHTSGHIAFFLRSQKLFLPATLYFL